MDIGAFARRWGSRLSRRKLAKLLPWLLAVLLLLLLAARPVRLHLIRTHRIAPPLHEVNLGMSRAAVRKVLHCRPADTAGGGEGVMVPFDQALPGGRVYRTWRQEHPVLYEHYRSWPLPRWVPVFDPFGGEGDPRLWRGAIKYRDHRVVAVSENGVVILGEGQGHRMGWPGGGH